MSKIFGKIAGSYFSQNMENIVNKATTMIGNESSDIAYLSAKAVYDWGIGSFLSKSGDIITVPNGGNIVGLTVIQLDIVNNPRGVDITNYGTNNGFKLTQRGNTSNSTSVGGAINLDNTLNTGAGFVAYTAQGATGTGHLIVSRVNNVLFPQSAIYGTSNGASHTTNILYTGTNSTSSALSAGSTNKNFSAMQVSGVETNHGTIKAANTYNGVDDNANAAVLSLDRKGEGTKAQGIFIDSTTTSGSIGDLLNFQNATIRKFRMDYKGHGLFYGDNGDSSGYTKLRAKDLAGGTVDLPRVTGEKTLATTNDVIPYVLRCDGAGYANVPDNASYSVATTGELTVRIKFRLNSLSFANAIYSSDGYYVEFFGKATTGQNEWLFRIYEREGSRPNRISFYHFNPDGGLGAGSYFQDVVQIGEIIYATGRCKTSTDHISIFKNGILRDTDTLSGYSIVPVAGTAPVTIGYCNSQAGPGYLEADIFECKIWNRYLSDTEILNDYLGQDIENGLVLWMNMFVDPANSTRVTDLSTLANHGTLIGTGILADSKSKPPKKYTLGFIGWPIASTTAVNINTANRMWFQKLIIDEPIDITKMITGISVQSGNLDVGIFSNRGKLLASSGITAMGTVGEQVLNLDKTLKLGTGIYRLAITCDNLTATFRSAEGLSYLLDPNGVRYKDNATFTALGDLSGPVSSESWYDGRFIALLAQ